MRGMMLKDCVYEMKYQMLVNDCVYEMKYQLLAKIQVRIMVNFGWAGFDT